MNGGHMNTHPSKLGGRQEVLSNQITIMKAIEMSNRTKWAV